MSVFEGECCCVRAMWCEAVRTMICFRGRWSVPEDGSLQAVYGYHVDFSSTHPCFRVCLHGEKCMSRHPRGHSDDWVDRRAVRSIASDIRMRASIAMEEVC